MIGDHLLAKGFNLRIVRFLRRSRQTLPANSFFRLELSDGHLAPGCAVNFSGDVTSLVAGQEDEDRGDLSRLAGTSEDSL